jgi:hypothetical protein
MISLTQKFILGITVIFISTIYSFGQNYQISLLTCDPGQELYSAFGHSAIRVQNPDNNEDYVFNYGTFNFNTPNFYLKFTQRTLDYMLSVSTFEQFLLDYKYHKRSVREQILNLNPQQAEAVYNFLQVNYSPQNRYYRYDFFYDNCATRIRDLMTEVLGNQIAWKNAQATDGKTFRNLIDEYVYPLPWADFGIDLALGSVIDEEATTWEKQFLPDYMEAAFETAEIIGDGPKRPLVAETKTLLNFPTDKTSADLLQPSLIFWLFALIAIVITFIGFKKKRLFIGFDITLFTVLGVVGLVIVSLWFFTFHSQTKWNWNILWAFPFHLAITIGLLQQKAKYWIRHYLLFALIMADAAVVFWILGWQSFHPAIMPILLIIILRTNFLYYNLDRFRVLKSS